LFKKQLTEWHRTAHKQQLDI